MCHTHMLCFFHLIFLDYCVLFSTLHSTPCNPAIYQASHSMEKYEVEKGNFNQFQILHLPTYQQLNHIVPLPIINVCARYCM